MPNNHGIRADHILVKTLAWEGGDKLTYRALPVSKRPDELDGESAKPYEQSPGNVGGLGTAGAVEYIAVGPCFETITHERLKVSWPADLILLYEPELCDK